MIERSILFNTEMVQAILDGRKTQTRRPIEPQPDKSLVPGDTLKTWTYDPCNKPSIALGWRDTFTHPGMDLTGAAICDYGQSGDRLWVRETWAYRTAGIGYIYRADGEGMVERWKPSIHMPREACRIVLEIVDVRVEQLQTISESDALEEGIETALWDRCIAARNYKSGGWFQVWNDGLTDPNGNETKCVRNEQLYRESFRSLWDSINAKRGYGWNTNPWVWVIEFKKIDGGVADE